MAETATATEVQSGLDAAAKYRTVRRLCFHSNLYLHLYLAFAG